MIYLIDPGQESDVVFVRTDEDARVRELASGFGHDVLGVSSRVAWLTEDEIINVQAYRNMFIN